MTNNKKIKKLQALLKKVNSFSLQELPATKRLPTLNGGCPVDDD